MQGCVMRVAAMPPRKRPQSTQDSLLIDSLGGTSKLAEALGYRDKGGPQRVSNWRARGIPAHVKLSRPDLFLRDLPLAAPTTEGVSMHPKAVATGQPDAKPQRGLEIDQWLSLRAEVNAHLRQQAAMQSSVPADGLTLEEKFNAYRRERQPLLSELKRGTGSAAAFPPADRHAVPRSSLPWPSWLRRLASALAAWSRRAQ